MMKSHKPHLWEDIQDRKTEMVHCAYSKYKGPEVEANLAHTRMARRVV